MTIDAEDILIWIILLVVFGVAGFFYIAIGAIFADLLSMNGLAWWGVAAAWPVVFVIAWMIFAIVMAGIVRICRAIRGTTA